MTLQAAPGSIVVGVDGSPGSDLALDWAADVAAAERRPLTLLHGVDPAVVAGAGDYPGATVDHARLAEQIRLEDDAMMSSAASRAHGRHPDLDVHPVLTRSDPRSALLDLSAQAAMVVIGSRGRGPVASLLLGSVGVAVARHASCPVVVRRPGGRDADGVLVGVDGTAQSSPPVEFAYRVAALRSVPLTVMHCRQDGTRGPAASGGSDPQELGDERVLVAESIAGMREKYPDVDVTVRLVHGSPAEELLSAAAGCGLLVVGHRRLSPVRSLVHGSVATTVVEHGTGPVAVVPSG
ncbi:universal stress protein [Jannaschia sp. R86511]|uniref:universal stress protein n=1 Tax=Jannaschia sp. R86511 TaxID=3093853 RepID=UPI0036D26336